MRHGFIVNLWLILVLASMVTPSLAIDIDNPTSAALDHGRQPSDNRFISLAIGHPAARATLTTREHLAGPARVQSISNDHGVALIIGPIANLTIVHK